LHCVLERAGCLLCGDDGVKMGNLTRLVVRSGLREHETVGGAGSEARGLAVQLLSRGCQMGGREQHGIKARGKRKFIATTDSNHGLPVAENLLNREFQPTVPNAVWSSARRCCG